MTLSDRSDSPFHELIALAKEQGLAVDFSLYSKGQGTWDEYEGGSRITGHDGDPMDVIRAGVRALRDRAASDEERPGA